MDLSTIFCENYHDLRIINKDDENYASVFDIIKCLGCKNPRSMFFRLSDIHAELKNMDRHKFKGAGQRETFIIAEKNIPKLIKLYLSRSTISLENKQIWLERIGEPDYIPYFIQTEAEIITIIQKSFQHFESKSRYYIKPYYLDLYFINENIAVECDENDHKSYDLEKDNKRTIFITEKQKCTWVRFDPYAKEFNVGDIISKIMTIIMKQQADKLNKK